MCEVLVPLGVALHGSIVLWSLVGERFFGVKGKNEKEWLVFETKAGWGGQVNWLYFFSFRPLFKTFNWKVVEHILPFHQSKWYGGRLSSI